MAQKPARGDWLFSESVLALRRIKLRFEELHRVAPAISVVCCHVSSPLPESIIDSTFAPLSQSRLRRFLRNVGMRFASLSLGKGRPQKGNEPKTKELSFKPGWFFDSSSRPQITRSYLVKIPPDLKSCFYDVARDASMLILNVTESHGFENSFRQIFPEIPDGASLRVNAGLWLDLVLEVGRWGLPSVPFRFSGTGKFEGDGKYGGRQVDIRQNDCWRNPNQPCLLLIEMTGFALMSAAVIDLLIEWSESGSNPFRSRITALVQTFRKQNGFNALFGVWG